MEHLKLVMQSILEFGDNTAVSTTIDKIDENPVTVLADNKALDFILKLEEVCGCEMEEEHEEEHPITK